MKMLMVSGLLIMLISCGSEQHNTAHAPEIIRLTSDPDPIGQLIQLDNTCIDTCNKYHSKLEMLSYDEHVKCFECICRLPEDIAHKIYICTK